MGAGEAWATAHSEGSDLTSGSQGAFIYIPVAFLEHSFPEFPPRKSQLCRRKLFGFNLAPECSQGQLSAIGAVVKCGIYTQWNATMPSRMINPSHL